MSAFLFYSNISGLDERRARRPGRARVAGSAFAWSLLDWALEMRCGIPMPEIAQDPRGKPHFPPRPELHFSLSHSDTHVLCAISSVPVGCDIQSRRALKNGFVERITTQEERRDFEFFELWVLRESFYKLTGEGDLRKIRFSRSGGEIVAPTPGICSRLYDGISDCAAALCTVGDGAPEELTMVAGEALLR